MKRLLCIVGGMNAGGAETFLMKVYRTLEPTEYQMDFAVSNPEKGYYDDEILARGGRIHHITPKTKGAIRNFLSVRKIVKENGYRCVLRTSQHSLSALELLAAWMGGAKVRVFRSSNSNTTTGSKKQAIMHGLCGFMPKCFANVRLAPSTEAAEFMFGKGCIRSGTAYLLHNAVDLSVYRYDADSREKILKELGIPGNTLVVGHVGRLHKQKNHSFLLEVFASMLKSRPDSVLLLVGKGEMEDSIRAKAAELGIERKVILAGVRSDIPAVLSAMDVMVFPSFYEGMPNTVIEAQATGLPCVIADTVTREADLTGLVTYLPLTDPDLWAKTALSAVSAQRKDTHEDFVSQGYDIEGVARQFAELILEA